ncbi:glycerophosphodiester phosphodiesterase [Desulfurobacterium atlanticum]|uniref:Glycerophosphoryl diester phosphodiesterase n=1 Tax=Desulfurobacterium atlanticum TaxID=240169 RepID=A0A238YCK1_9BACT|nr:glycerophosphodiester phosphodiesterase [Desulfurobacterium atlanticum]SNR68790.1 glycerophosphoryl diester phosphodiesterase [Desulfurobacterium atlanticum]
MLITAHNGCENTVQNSFEAIKVAVESGADVVEVDVRITGDAVPIVFHDEDILVNGEKKKISEISFEKFRKGGFFNGIFLEEVFEFLKDEDVIVNLDVKTDDAIVPMVEMVRRFDFFDRVFATGCEYDRVVKFKKLFPDFRVFLNVPMFSFSGKESLKGLYSILISSGACGINMNYKYCFPEFVKFFHKRFFPVSVWTVDAENDMEKAIRMEVFSITTNYPVKLRKIIENSC